MNKRMTAPLTGCVLALLLGVSTLAMPGTAGPAAPEYSAEGLRETDWMEQLGQDLAGRVPGGGLFRAAGNRLSLLLGTSRIGDVFVLSDRLVEGARSVNPVTARQNTAAIDDFALRYPDQTVYLSLVPTAAEVYRDQLPPEPNQLDQLAVINGVYGDFAPTQQTAGNTGGSAYGTVEHAATVDVHTALLASRRQDLFYRTDSCWTSLGAYTAYTSLMTGLGETAVSRDLFHIEYAPGRYYGDLAQRTLLGRGWGDRIDLYLPASGSVVRKLICYDEGEAEIRDSLYDTAALESEDRTAVFLGGERGVTVLETRVENGRSLLLFGDDYARPMLQFLALHYQTIALVDLGKLAPEEAELIDPAAYQTVLFLYPVTSYVSDTSISARLDAWTGAETE